MSLPLSHQDTKQTHHTDSANLNYHTSTMPKPPVL